MPTPDHLAATGVSGLDEILGGGFPRETFCLVRGTAGCGKTTLCLQFLMEGARRGEPSLYVGTSETEADIQRIARSHGWSLDGVRVYHLAARSGDVQTVLHPAEVELPATVESILAVVEEVEPVRLVIDSLTEIRILARDEFWYRQQLMSMKQHFHGRRATVVMTDLAAENAVVNSIVNGVVELDQTPPVYGPARRRVRITKMRGQDNVTGHHDAMLGRGGLQVFPRLTAAGYRGGFPREKVSTGIAELDAMLHGGLIRGSSTLLLGPTGTGKSVLATQLAIASAERGEKAHIFAFDERVQTYLHRAESMGMGLADHAEAKRVILQQVDPTEMTTGEFSHRVRSAILEDGVRMIVIDSLNGYGHAMPEERFLNAHLSELLSFLTQNAVQAVCTLTMHGLIAQESAESLDVSYLSDCVILMRPFEFDGEVHKAVSVYKNRSGGHESSIRELRITEHGPKIGKPLRRFHGVLTGTPSFLGEELGRSD